MSSTKDAFFYHSPIIDPPKMEKGGKFGMLWRKGEAYGMILEDKSEGGPFVR